MSTLSDLLMSRKLDNDELVQEDSKHSAKEMAETLNFLINVFSFYTKLLQRFSSSYTVKAFVI